MSQTHESNPRLSEKNNEGLYCARTGSEQQGTEKRQVAVVVVSLTLHVMEEAVSAVALGALSITCT